MKDIKHFNKSTNDLEDDEEDEEELSADSREESSDENESPDPEKSGLSKSAYRKINGVVPKDIDQKKEMMSFIAYI